MTMQAVKLAPKNFRMLSIHTAISVDQLYSMYEDAVQLGEIRYIIPNYVNPNDGQVWPWADVREDYFYERFSFDKDQIDTPFFEITRK